MQNCENTGPKTTLPSAFGALESLAERLSGFDAKLVDMVECKDRAVAAQARKLRRQIREFEPNITMIGQVKAGKTTLVNSMVGWADFLPADVNPWTSVVTSLHLQRTGKSDDRRASFRFFTNEEWDKLITQGGRVGEMADRAGAADELEKVRAQLDEMRAKSRARLGNRFEMLLGQTHDYNRFDENLIQRYVCLGDDFWEEADGSPEQGRFADITKTADLWFGAPGLAVPLCIQDTPGVNDTFMIREQITINALRGSRLCVMVLSAQQALSSVDLGLIRMISNVRARDVIIFVNRIDELADPVREVPEIRASIRATLDKFDGPKDAEILFGSGFWASHAVGQTCDRMGEDSSSALVSWAEANVTPDHKDMCPTELVWHLSGVAALGDAISARIENGTGARMIERLENAISNLSTSLAASDSLNAAHAADRPVLTAAEMADKFADIQQAVTSDLHSKLTKAEAAFVSRIEKSQLTFLGRATSSLVNHLEHYGEDEVWTYDPAGLRMLLRSAYQVFLKASARAGKDALSTAAQELSALYPASDELAPELLPPPLPSAPPPVALGQTIALDLKGGWWTRFWRRRRGYQAFFDDFAKLIHEETAPVISALQTENADAHAEALRQELRGFFDAQHATLSGLYGSSNSDETNSGPLANAHKTPQGRSYRQLLNFRNLRTAG